MLSLLSSTYYPFRIFNNIQSTPSPCINNMMHSASTLSFFLLQKYQAKQMWEQVTIFKSLPILSPTPLPVYAMRLQKQSAFFFYLRFVFHQPSSVFQVLFMTLGAPQVTGEKKRAQAQLCISTFAFPFNSKKSNCAVHFRFHSAKETSKIQTSWTDAVPGIFGASSSQTPVPKTIFITQFEVEVRTIHVQIR